MLALGPYQVLIAICARAVLVLGLSVLCFCCRAPTAMIELSDLSVSGCMTGILLAQPVQWLPQLSEGERRL